MPNTTILLHKGSQGPEVELLQALLKTHGYDLPVDGDFGPRTDTAVRDFQRRSGLEADGYVGNLTFAALKGQAPPPGLRALTTPMRDLPMPRSEYLPSVVPKRTIVLHHTAGSHRPDNVIRWWSSDNQGRVATAFVIGGLPTSGPADTSFDGVIYRAFDERYWAYHLGIQGPGAGTLDAQAVAIEICNWGFLRKTADGRYLNYVGGEVPDDQVVKLAKPFRGFSFYHRYTDAQLVSVRMLVLDLADKFSVQVKGKYAAGWFKESQQALAGAPGLWSHIHYRLDKTDLSPQPAVIDMLNSL